MVKDLIINLIDAKSANAIVKRYHYSGKVVMNSNLHFGVFKGKALMGAMSFGSPMDKNKAIGIVKNTEWGGMLELNRMAFAPSLPKNAESRCLAIALRMIKKKYPHVKWIQTFADCCQCGDGTIYRAVGFYLIAIKKNTSIRRLENGRIVVKRSLDDKRINGRYLSSIIKSEPIEGFQIKYIYFLDPEKQKDLTVPILPYSEIERRGAKMYLGKKCVSSLKVKQQPPQAGKGGAIPTDTLQQINGEVFNGTQTT